MIEKLFYFTLILSLQFLGGRTTECQIVINNECINVSNYSLNEKIYNLSLKNCSCKDVPFDIDTLRELRNLKLEDCKSLGNFLETTQLESLTINNCELNEMFIKNILLRNDDLYDLTLMGVSVSDEMLRHIGKSSLFYLKLINLTHLKDVSFLINSSDYLAIDLSSNEIQKIPTQFEKFNRLKSINLSHNNLTRFPYCLQKIKTLTNISLVHNKMKCPQNNLVFNQLAKLEVLNGNFQEKDCELNISNHKDLSPIIK